jgi:hypothetical protein
MLTGFGISRSAIRKVLLLPVVLAAGWNASAMAQAPAAANASKLGTVKAISGNSVTLATDAGQQITVTLGDAVKVVKLPPGSTDLKTATPGAVSDIAVGDRALISGKTGDTPDQFVPARVVLMKSGDIAQKHAQEQADWQKRGSGGLVTAVDPSTGTVTIAVGAKKVAVKTSSATVFRRYSGDSIKFEDAVPGKLAQVQVGDQLRVRGDKSADGDSMQADEIVSGSFLNLSGVIATLDPATGTLTLKDLTTKKNMTVKVTANSDLRALPERTAAMFAARAKGGAAGAGGAGAAGGGAGAAGAGGGAGRGPGGAGPGGAGPGGPGGGGPGGGGRSAGMDLSQMLSRLPTQKIDELKTGEAVMIVASQAAPSSTTVTAVTLLSGVEPILAASPTGDAMTLSPWNMGGGGADAGAGP